MAHQRQNLRLGEWLRRQLEIRQWSAADLARQAGMSSGRLSDVMNGRSRLGAKGATQLAEALNLDVEEVYRAAGLIPTEDNSEDIVWREQINGLVNRIEWDSTRASIILMQLRFFRQEDLETRVRDDED